MARIVVLGAGFAGLWAAIGAARKRDEIGANSDIEIRLVDRNPYHNVRVRNYEADLGEVALVHGTGGVFVVRVDGDEIWSRKERGFPELAELKRLVRDRAAPGRDLGHSERR